MGSKEIILQSLHQRETSRPHVKLISKPGLLGQWDSTDLSGAVISTPPIGDAAAVTLYLGARQWSALPHSRCSFRLRKKEEGGRECSSAGSVCKHVGGLGLTPPPMIAQAGSRRISSSRPFWFKHAHIHINTNQRRKKGRKKKLTEESEHSHCLMLPQQAVLVCALSPKNPQLSFHPSP